MVGKSYDRLLLELREANEQFDSGDLTKEELNAILNRVFVDFRDLSQEKTASKELLKYFTPLEKLNLSNL